MINRDVFLANWLDFPRRRYDLPYLYQESKPAYIGQITGFTPSYVTTPADRTVVVCGVLQSPDFLDIPANPIIVTSENLRTRLFQV